MLPQAAVVQCASGHVPMLGAEFWAVAVGMADGRQGCAQLFKYPAHLAAAGFEAEEHLCLLDNGLCGNLLSILKWGSLGGLFLASFCPQEEAGHSQLLVLLLGLGALTGPRCRKHYLQHSHKEQ